MGISAATQWSTESATIAWSAGKKFTKDVVIARIQESLAIRDQIAEQRKNTLAFVGTVAKAGFITGRDSVTVALNRAAETFDAASNYSRAVRQNAVIGFAKMLGVDERLKTVDEAPHEIASNPLEYKTKLRKEGKTEVIAALHLNITNILGDPYARASVVLFSNPKVAVSNDNGLVTFHGVEVGRHRIEIHTGNNVEARDIVISPPADSDPKDEQAADVVLPVVQVVITEAQHGAAPDRATFPPLALLLIGMLTLGNLYTFYPIFVRRKKYKKEKA